LNANYYYTITAGIWKMRPNAGLSYQSNSVNTFSGLPVAESNDYTFSMSTGVNLGYKKIGFSAMAFLPVKQRMYGGQTTLSMQHTIGVTYSF